MIKTYGLTHLNLAVLDLDRSARFYEQVFGAKITYRDANMVQIETPGAHDAIVLERKTSGIGETGGIGHFGFRLVNPADIDAAVREVEAGGGKLLRRGDHAPGVPYAYVSDPDGYEVEIWYE